MDFIKKLGLKKKSRVKFKTEETKNSIKNKAFSGTDSNKLEKFMDKMGPIVWDVLDKKGSLDDFKKSVGAAIFSAAIGMDAEIITKFMIMDGSLALNSGSKISSFKKIDWDEVIKIASGFCVKKYGDDYDSFFDDLNNP